MIVGDSNMSETTTLLKVGATDLVLRMIEAGIVFRDLTLENPIRAIREVSHDVTSRRRVKLANGREATALDIQREYHQKAADFVDRRGGDPVSKRVVELWGRTLDAIATGDLSLIDREIDWATKFQLIERYRAKHGLTLSSPRVAQLDLAYHDIHRGRGLYYLLEKKGAVDRVASDVGDLRGQEHPAADDQGPAARRVHPPGAGEAARLHRRLGAPQAQRPGPAHRAVQGPVPLPVTSGSRSSSRRCRPVPDRNRWRRATTLDGCRRAGPNDWSTLCCACCPPGSS